MALIAELDTHALPAFAGGDLALWNWQAAFLPGAAAWEEWLRRAAARLLSEPRMVRARLTQSRTGGDAPQVLALEAPQTLRIGRAPENDVVLLEGTVTRQHAELRWEEDRLYLVELGSSLGTLVNGAKAQANVPVELAGGAEFVIFPYRFQVALQREWIPVSHVALREGRQTLSTAADFVAGHHAGCELFSLQTQAGPTIHLAIEHSLLEGLTAQALAPLDAPPFLLPGSRRAWRELLVQSALTEANRDLRPEWHLTLRQSQAPAGRGIEYRVLAEIAGLHGAIACFLPASALPTNTPTARSNPPLQESLADRASWDFQFSLGEVELTRRERKSLEPGDVVLFVSAPALRSSGWGFALSGQSPPSHGTQWRVEKMINGRKAMNAESLTDFDDLPLNVEIVVGQKELTLREASALTPGAILDLDRYPADAVQLVVNGRLLGAGHLVTIDGRLGVRISQWTGGPA
jgi:type III secretion system YscQ/HrcQ family protein